MMMKIMKCCQRELKVVILYANERNQLSNQMMIQLMNQNDNEATDDEDEEQTKPTRHRKTKTKDPTIDYEILNELKQLGE
ncbi:hypothetical protein M9Y10_013366 [Tritrichomonas musculus]|uniref:Uncharacterized protein n=1 Tax=Tritrichomonas musculus TaxID=1915356 RepID=A0ABR2I899_9EUKA